jgi:hypothetical protein
MSSVSVVMNKGVLLDAICKTANLAWGPMFRAEIVSLRVFVARVYNARRIAIASM